MSHSLKIIFDNVDNLTNVYYPGSTVTGKVIFMTNNPKKARGLRIEIKGCAQVEWSTRADKSDRYHAEEEYFSNRYYVIGSANDQIVIPEGEYVYPFQTTLPPGLPSSFESTWGHIRYTIKAIVDRAWKIDYEAKVIFTVCNNTPIDLNYIAVAREPVKKETEKCFCCFFCKSGPLTLIASLPFTGYTPGQDVPVTIEIDNASSVAIEAVECKLIKVTTWTARKPSQRTKTDTFDLAKISLEGVEEHGSRSWTHNLPMPTNATMPFINIDACSIIDINFLLKVQAVASGLHINLSTEIPLVLGTIPINQGGDGIPQMVLPEVQLDFSSGPGFTTGPSPKGQFTSYQNVPQSVDPPYPNEQAFSPKSKCLPWCSSVSS